MQSTVIASPEKRIYSLILSYFKSDVLDAAQVIETRVYPSFREWRVLAYRLVEERNPSCAHKDGLYNNRYRPTCQPIEVQSSCAADSIEPHAERIKRLKAKTRRARNLDEFMV